MPAADLQGDAPLKEPPELLVREASRRVQDGADHVQAAGADGRSEILLTLPVDVEGLGQVRYEGAEERRVAGMDQHPDDEFKVIGRVV